MSKLNEQEIACLHGITTTRDQCGPIGGFFVKRLTGGARLSTVVHQDIVFVEELLQHLCPSTLVGRTIRRIVRHGGIANGVHLLLRLYWHPHREQSQGACHEINKELVVHCKLF